jgi:hypothetical protein
MNKKLNYGSFSVLVPEEWDDMTKPLGDPSAPTTVANARSGGGAFQFLSAIYKSGKSPNISVNDLRSMLDEFVLTHGLDQFQERIERSDPMGLVGGEGRSGEDYIAVWYASDGKSVVLITYVCNWEDRANEKEVRNAAVASTFISSSAIN